MQRFTTPRATTWVGNKDLKSVPRTPITVGKQHIFYPLGSTISINEFLLRESRDAVNVHEALPVNYCK